MLGVTEKRLESTESSIGWKSTAAAMLTSPPTVIVSDGDWAWSSMEATLARAAQPVPGDAELAKFSAPRPSTGPTGNVTVWFLALDLNPGSS